MLLCIGGSSILVGAQEGDDPVEDAVDGEDDLDATVETDDGAPIDGASAEAVAADSEKEDEDEEAQLKPSPNADTYILFTQPSGTGELSMSK